MKTLNIIGGLCVFGLMTIANAQDTTKTTVVTTTTTTTPAVTTTPVPAETNTEQRIEYPQVGTHLGLKFQPTFTSLRSTGYETNAAKVSATFGYGYGASINYFFSNNVGMHFEILYSQIRQKYTDNTDQVRNLDVSYFDVPLLFSLNSDYGRKVNFNVAIGPQVGVLSGAKFSGSSNEEVANVDATVALKTVGFGLGYGAGLDFGMGESHSTHINLGVRGIAGYSNTLGVYLGFMFKL